MASLRSQIVLPLALLVLLIPTALAGMYGEFVSELTASNFDEMVVKSAETWVVKFYAPWCGHCKSSAPAFSKAAKRLHGVVRLGVVDCDSHGELAQRFGVRGFPTIKTFSGEGSRARRPSDYSGDRSANAITSHARYIQPSFVAHVMPKGADSFFGDLKRLPHVLLFTDKAQTSGMYKGMSARFRKTIAFGESRQKDGSSTAEKYGVTSFPTLLVFPPGNGAPESAVKYAGKMDPDSLIKHFEAVEKQGAAGAGQGESADDGASSAEERKPKFAQPKAYNGEIETIASRADYVSKCGNRNDGRLCMLGLLPGGAEHALKESMAETAKRYLYDNLAFAVIDTNVDGAKQFAAMFGDAPFVAVRAKKQKFSVMSADGEPDIAAISAFVDRVVGGEVRYAKHGDLPDWDAPKADGEQSKGGANATQEESADEGQCGVEPPADGESCGGKSGSANADAAGSSKTEL